MLLNRVGRELRKLRFLIRCEVSLTEPEILQNKRKVNFWYAWFDSLFWGVQAQVIQSPGTLPVRQLVVTTTVMFPGGANGKLAS